jgi:LemA protein
MSRGLKSILAFVAVIVLLGGCSFSAYKNFYNGMLGHEKTVEQKWADVEATYQSRADKVKNLAAIVKNAADFEQETLTEVIEARSKATSVNISAGDLTPEKLAQFEQVQSQLSSSLGRLLAVIERYPDLKAVQAYRDFQAEYAGIENRIRVARQDYNAAVRDYNFTIEKFPNNIFNNLLGTGFESKPSFEAAEGSEDAPDVDGLLER